MPCALPPVNCLGFDGNPFINTSTEAPDQFDFLYEAWGPNYLPPLGWTWTSLGSYGTSGVSPGDALIIADNATTGTWRSPTNQPHPPRNIFSNDAQSGNSTCPDGNPYEYKVPAGMFKAGSKAAANEAAIDYGNQQAILHAICFSDLPATLCLAQDIELNIFASSAFLAPPGSNTWAIVSGSLPPGLSLSMPGTGPAVLSGSPTTTGDYSFVLGITLPNGDNTTKEFFVTVAGITNADTLPDAQIGAPYSGQLVAVGFSNPVYLIESGMLPHGLTLSLTGAITGTPANDAESESFTVTMRDETTGFQCQQDVDINIQMTCQVPTQQWSVNTSLGGGNFAGLAARTNPPTTPPPAQHQMILYSDGNGGGNTLLKTIRMDDQSVASLTLAGLSCYAAAYAAVNDVFVLAGSSGIARVACEPLSLISNNTDYTNGAYDVAYCSFNQLIYVLEFGFLSVYDPVTDVLIDSVDLGALNIEAAQAAISFDNANKVLYFAGYNSSSLPHLGIVAAFDISTTSPFLIAQYQVILPNGGQATSIGGAFFVPDNGYAYVTAATFSPSFSESIVVIDPAHGATVAQLTLTSGPNAVWYNPVTKLVYVTDGTIDRLICATSNIQVATLNLTLPFRHAFSPFNNSMAIQDQQATDVIYDYA